MIEIVERLYLGNHASASNREQLRSAGITHVVNCADELPCHFEGELVYKALRLHDPDPTFHTRLADVRAFIDVARRQGGVLVHCVAAVSRSPAIVLTYLCHMGETLEAAAERLGQRAWTDPAPIFLEQLGVYLGRPLGNEDLKRIGSALRGAAGGWRRA